MNWINYLASQEDKEMEVLVFTMGTSVVRQFVPPSSRVKIIRPAKEEGEVSVFRRYGNYIRFYTVTAAKLATWKPGTVLYYETLSSLPAILYKKIFNRRSRLLVHYHEYMDPGEYQRGMLLDRILHKWETKIYPECSWVSHTNEQRLAFFKKDNHPVRIGNPRVMPNYPPGKWVIREPKTLEKPLRLVHVGSLSLDSMYVKELATWVIAQKGKVVLDIYSLRINIDTKNYLSALNTDLIRFLGGCTYDDLPNVLSRYSVGVVLYKGLNASKNTIYAASNKLFEYHACGLEVWFSQEMLGSHIFTTTATFPKIIPVDFTKLEKFNVDEAIDRKGMVFRSSPYFYEEVFNPLLNMFYPAEIY
ncbi:glycosyltransferase family protein [Flavitalea flava]